MARNQNQNKSPSQTTIEPAVPVYRKGLIAIAVLLLLPWAVVWHIATQSREAGPESKKSQAFTLGDGKEFQTAPGKWGMLQCSPISFSAPPEQIEELTYAFKPSVWHFANTTDIQLKALCQRSELSEEETKLVAGAAKPAPEINGFTVVPEPQFRLNMSSRARDLIYSALLPHDLNVDQVNAYRTPARAFPQWFAGLKAPAPTRDLLKKLYFQHGEYYFFCDLPVVLPTITDPNERIQLFREITQEYALYVTLQVDDHSDIDALVTYWGRGGRQAKVRPILESVARIPGGGKIGLTSLLPTFAKTRLYTYPEPGSSGDCHWTSFNFFNEVPNQRLSSKQNLEDALKEYYPVYADFQLGDLVLFQRGESAIVHSAAFVADDIVFTKNGRRYSSPYMLMKIADVQAYYQCDQPVKYMRRKPRGELEKG